MIKTTFLFTHQDRDGGRSGDSHHTKLAQEDVVLRPHQTSGRLNMGHPRLSGSSVSGTDWPPCLLVSGFNGLAVKAQVLRDRGLSNFDIPTLL